MMKDKGNFVWDETQRKVFDDIKSEVATAMYIRMGQKIHRTN